MRVTFINQFYKPDISPTAHLCASVAEHRAALGDEVTVLTSRTGYVAPVDGANVGSALADAFRRVFNSRTRLPRRTLRVRPGVRVRRLWSTRLGSRSNVGRLLDWVSFYFPACWSAIILPRQDVFIALTTPPFIAIAAWLHKLLNPSTRLILWNMDVYPEAVERTKLVKPGGIFSRIMRAANRMIFRQVDHLVCLDDAMAELLLSQYTPRGRTIAHTIIPNWEHGTPLDKLEPRTSSEKFIVLYLGNAGYGHEFHTLIDAAARMRDEPVTFLFVGGGAMRPWIAQQCAQRRLGNIEFRDYVPKERTPETMSQADCALITLEEQMLGVMSPSKLHANLSMGLPVIYVGPPRSNVDEAIQRFGCGISLRPGNGEGLAQFVRDLMKNRDKHLQMRRSARRAFEEAYCDAKTLPRFDEVIDLPAEDRAWATGVRYTVISSE